MGKIAIVVDSSADITDKKAEELGVHVLRMPIIENDKQYIENDEISDEYIINSMKQGSVFKTSQPILGNIVLKFEELLKEYDEVIYIPLSSKLSGTYQSALVLSENFNGKITIVNALSVCACIQILIKYIKEMIDNGLTTSRIKEKIENESESYITLVPESLVYLKRGGRISPAAAALANMLKIVPIIKFENGELDVLDKVRTRKKAIDKAIENIISVENVNDYEFMVLQVACEDYEIYVDRLSELLNKEINVYDVRSIIMSHVGPGAIAFARVKKIDTSK